MERLKAQALKFIYGYEHSYKSLLELTGLQTLKDGRDARDLKFARNCLKKRPLQGMVPSPTYRPINQETADVSRKIRKNKETV